MGASEYTNVNASNVKKMLIIFYIRIFCVFYIYRIYNRITPQNKRNSVVNSVNVNKIFLYRAARAWVAGYRP